MKTRDPGSMLMLMSRRVESFSAGAADGEPSSFTLTSPNCRAHTPTKQLMPRHDSNRLTFILKKKTTHGENETSCIVLDTHEKREWGMSG